jgi:2',3'-cyclic-nucleotide 2'-phosphodiesterase (5'-nucleotidase family)
MGAIALFLFLAVSQVAHSAERGFTILAINDVYRIAGVDEGRRGGIARVRSLRAELEREHPDLLVLHAGDFLFPSLISRLYNGRQMIDVLNRVDGDALGFDDRMFVTFGNHEFDKSKLEHAALLEKRIEESQFRWLSANVEFGSGPDGRPWVESRNLTEGAIVSSGGVRVGVFGLTTDGKHPDYVAAFGAPGATARRVSARLRRRGAEVVVAVTHLRMSEDAALLRDLGPDGPDLIIGGHEHNKQSRKVTGRWVIKADADARTATVAHVTLSEGGPPRVEFEFRELGPDSPKPDGRVQDRVDEWLADHDRDYCREVAKRPPGCLATVLGRTRVELQGEELEIRRFESNLGDWIVDQARHAFADRGAQIAFVNAGGLRLNQNIPAGADITLRHFGEIFAYPSPMKLVRLSGASLQKAVEHAVQDWTGNGWWLQISGFAFRHDPDAAPGKQADRLTLLAPDGARPIRADEEILAVVNDFLLTRKSGQDGYTMLDPADIVDGDEPAPDLRDLVIEALEESGREGIAPAGQGRICNTRREGPCLALP